MQMITNRVSRAVVAVILGAAVMVPTVTACSSPAGDTEQVEESEDSEESSGDTDSEETEGNSDTEE